MTIEFFKKLFFRRFARTQPKISVPAAGSGAVPWEKVYVFISSTFNDMHAERDYLIKQVFPVVREWCEVRKLQLVDIDLRWGVTEQDALYNKNVVKVCLDRIDECRPFFLCFLGQRRGWVPLKEDVSKETRKSFPKLDRHIGEASVTELEILHALIEPFHPSKKESRTPGDDPYRRAQYACFYLREPTYLKDLPPSPPHLRQIYTNEGIEDLGERAENDRLLKTWREEKIPAAASAYQRPFRMYEAAWDVTAMTPEINLPMQSPSANKTKWRTEWKRAGIHVNEDDLRTDPVLLKQAEEFNHRLCAGRLRDFRCDGIPLSQVITNDLQDAIRSRFPDHFEVIYENELQKELDQQEQFLFVNSEGFIAREKDFDDLDAYVKSDSRSLFVLTAPGGMGKSTLLCNWVDRYRNQIEDGNHESIHFRFIGASDKSTTIDSTLQFLLLEIKEITNKLVEEIPENPLDRRNKLLAMLEGIGKSGKTILVLDALNQLETGLSDLSWLPVRLPENIKIIVSFRSDEPKGRELYERFRQTGDVILSEVKPFQDLEDRRKLIQAYLSQYLKQLDERHVDTLIRSSGAANPLYLKTVLSELRVFGAFGNLEDKIRDDFGETPQSPFDSVLRRLESDPMYSPIEPSVAVPLLFGLLAHARHGLSAQELASMIVQVMEKNQVRSRQESALESVHVFLRQVRPFLARRDGRYDYFYESFRLAAVARYAERSDKEIAPKRFPENWHLILANYFDGLSTWRKAASADQTAEPDSRKVAELPYHLQQAHDWNRLQTTLCDLDFIEAKCAAKMSYDLIAEYQSALVSMEEAGTNPSYLESFARYFQSQAHILSARPWLTFQQAANLAEQSPVKVAAQERWSKGLEKRSWFERRSGTSGGDPCIMTLSSHKDAVHWCSFSPDSQQIASASRDDTIKIWNAKTGVEIKTLAKKTQGCGYLPDGKLFTASCEDGLRSWETENWTEINLIPGYSPFSYSADGARLVANMRDNSLKVMDPKTGAALATLTGHTSFITACAFSRSGDRIVSGSDDFTARIWDTKTGKQLAVLKHGWPLVACLFSLDGQMVITTTFDSVVLWNSRTGMELGSLYRATPGVKIEACAFSADQKRFVVALTTMFVILSKKILILDAQTGGEIAALTGHAGNVYSCGFSPDGFKLISASADRTLKIWDASAKTGQESFTPHSGSVYDCAYSPDNRFLVSASQDKTLRVWNVETGSVTATLKGHSNYVSKCVVSPDSKRILSLSGDDTSRMWDAQSGSQQFQLTLKTGHVQKCLYTPDRRRIATICSDQTTKFWDADSGSLVQSLSHSEKVLILAFSPDGSRFVTAFSADLLTIWEANSLKEIIQFQLKPYTVEGMLVTPVPSQYGATGCAFSPDGKRILSASSRGNIYLWDAQSSDKIAVLKHDDEVVACTYSPDGKKIVSGSKDKTAVVWDAKTGEKLFALPHTDHVVACGFLPDGKSIYTAAGLKITFWRADNGKEMHCFFTEKDIISFSVARSGRSVTAGEDSGNVTILKPVSFPFALPLETLVRLYRFDTHSWDQEPSVSCVWCNERFCPSNAVQEINAIAQRHKLKTEDSPCLALPPEAWDDPGLVTRCPYCAQEFRLNPFIVGLHS